MNYERCPGIFPHIYTAEPGNCTSCKERRAMEATKSLFSALKEFGRVLWSLMFCAALVFLLSQLAEILPSGMLIGVRPAKEPTRYASYQALDSLSERFSRST
jgi:hypothetical protein